MVELRFVVRSIFPKQYLPRSLLYRLRTESFKIHPSEFASPLYSNKCELNDEWFENFRNFQERRSYVIFCGSFNFYRISGKQSNRFSSCPNYITMVMDRVWKQRPIIFALGSLPLSVAAWAHCLGEPCILSVLWRTLRFHLGMLKLFFVLLGQMFYPALVAMCRVRYWVKTKFTRRYLSRDEI